MSVAPAPSAGRGEVTLQPAYFTSSLFVHPLREDILALTQAFAERYAHAGPAQPFTMFKSIWVSQGWTSLHFKVLDARSRETFLNVVLRLFLERVGKSEGPLSRVVGIFGLYVFFYTQPTVPTPPLHSVAHIPIPSDLYQTLVTFPDDLATVQLYPLCPHVVFILKTLLEGQVFHIVPPTPYHALNPRELPREMFVQDNEGLESLATTNYGAEELSRKRGRPSKKEKARKGKDARSALEKWIEKTTYAPTTTGESATLMPPPVATHVLLSNPPSTSRNVYRAEKAKLRDNLSDEGAVRRANEAVLSRMRRIDRMAAERGLEVGGEGGERTGLARVEKAVTSYGGLLNLLEGAGLDM